MWEKFIRNISEEYVFNAPAKIKRIEEINNKFKIELPDELQSLLKETDGINDEYGGYLVWSTSRIIEGNSNLRSYDDFKDLYMPFDCLLFIADAGNGDLFAYSILNGSIQKEDIYVWNHENDSRTWVAPSLKKFIEWWRDGTISV
ncbi:SMI1/KNR4 family protein [Bacillus pseudomycoides]|uniref:SMI1/KNR4 family protein n=1 Tax=Bacillus pseudomycoides TaxID=64104 RepID=UPI001FB1C7DD|nr:SMI1/KNR4 family protein [Bacillus pseudomycoides]